MSARARSARKSTASTFSYAELPSSGDEDEDDELSESGRGGGGGRNSKAKGPTKRAKGKAKAVEVDDGGEGDEDDPPRKKARGPAKGKQRKQNNFKGQLEVFKTLPVEMITEIFSHLYPNDLLALSMVNKQYRALLTAKSSARLWKAARDKLKLPDVVTDRFSEIQYANLVFGRNCQLCGVGNYVSIEPRLRVRYCKSCRTQEIVKLRSLKRMYPDVLAKLHPRAKDVVIQSGGQILISDLYRASVILRDLEDQDEDDDIAEGNVAPPLAPPQSSSTGRRRRSRRFSSKTWTPRQDDMSDNEDDSASPYTRRVNEYIVARSALYKEINKHARSIKTAYAMAKQHLQSVKWQSHGQAAVENDPDRESALRQKVLDLNLGYTRYDFWGPWSRSKLVKSPDPLTDEEWVRIKPKLLKLLDRRKAREVKQDLVQQQRARQYGRQSSLRTHYNALMGSLPESARPFAPLFLDFLLLPSVKTLCAGDTDVSEQAWRDALEDIKEDLSQFRLDLVAHVRELIFEATTDPDNPSSTEDDRDLGDDDLDLDAFFSLATSFVCCGHKDCKAASRRYDRRWLLGRARFNVRKPRHLGAVGPLVRVLEHLHEHHNYSTHGTCDSQASPRFNVKVPLEVVCATSAILELNHLDPGTAGVEELKQAERMVQCYTWENRRSTRRTFWGENGWPELLFAIRTEGDKLSRMKPPVYLDPPVIVMHSRHTPYPSDTDTAGAKSKFNGGAAAAVQSKAGFDLFGGDSEDDSMLYSSDGW
ncbi:hypothetical protein JCM3775_002872 [Rhodotorula graminis]